MDAGFQTGQSVHTKETIQAHVLQRCKEQKYTHKNNNCFVFLQCGGTLCNRLKLGVNPQSWAVASSESCQKKKKKRLSRNKNKNQRWCLTPAGSRWTSAEQFPLQLTYKVSTFLFLLLSCSISSLKNWVTPSFSGCLSISILHSKPPPLHPPPPPRHKGVLPQT